jgi:hypothetical protein
VPTAAQYKNLVSELLANIPEAAKNQILKKYALTQPTLF